MILTLEGAKLIDPTITQSDLDALEQMVRSETNNHFYVLSTRKQGYSVMQNGAVVLQNVLGLFATDTIELNGTMFNDGVYTVLSLAEDGAPVLIVDSTGKQLVEELGLKEAILTKIHYPEDVIRGVRRLIAYDSKMGSKLGIKSESVSRVSVTYYDLNASDNQHGYPKALMTFLQPYRRMRW